MIWLTIKHVNTGIYTGRIALNKLLPLKQCHRFGVIGMRLFFNVILGYLHLKVTTFCNVAYHNANGCIAMKLYWYYNVSGCIAMKLDLYHNAGGCIPMKLSWDKVVFYVICNIRARFLYFKSCLRNWPWSCFIIYSWSVLETSLW